MSDARQPTEPEGTELEDMELTQDATFARLLRRVAGAPSFDGDKSSELEPGTVLDDKLRVGPVLGRGGMGVVYLAEHLKLSRQVALKLTLGGTAMDTARLLREAQAMASVTHENVITVYDVGTLGEQVFIAMEYLDGGTLKGWLAEAPRPWRDIRTHFLRAGRGLAAAHACGVIHRDFKPDNILLGRDGRLRVADFGLARGIDAGPGDLEPTHDALASRPLSRLTETGVTAGTPAYMAPEQLAGQDADARSDQFAFCVSLFEGFFGERPFFASTAGAQYEHIMAGKIVLPKATTQVPTHVRRAILRGLAPTPTDRFDDMRALLGELSRDPAAQIRRGALAVGAAFVIAGATWVVASARSGDPCATADTPLEGIWDADVAAKVEAGFTASEAKGADLAWRGTHGVLDSYAEAWTAARHDACEATRIHHTQSEDLLGLRVACLQHARSALRGTVHVLLDADRLIVHHAQDAAASLPELEHCRDLEALDRIGGVPQDKQEAVDSIRDAVSEALANTAAGRPQVGLQRATAVLAEAEALGVNAALAEALDAIALAEEKLGDWDNARAHNLASIAAASRARNDVLVARTAVRMLYIEGYQLSLPSTQTWKTLSDAWIERVGSPSDLRQAYHSALGLIARRAGHYEQAIQHFEAGSALGAGTLGRTAISFRGMIAVTHRLRGDLHTAKAMTEENIRAARSVLGPAHPLLAQELNHAGAIATNLGDNEAAADAFTRALAIRREALGPDNRLVGATLQNLAQTKVLGGDPAGASEMLSQALLILEANNDASGVAIALSTRAMILLELDKLDDAALAMGRAIEIVDKEFGEDSHDAVMYRYNLASIERDRGNYEIAMALAQRAHRNQVASGNENLLLGSLIVAVRGAIHLKLGDPSQALADSVAALEYLDTTQVADRDYRIDPLLVAGKAAIELDRPDDALHYLENALAAGGRSMDVDLKREVNALVAKVKLGLP